MEQIKLAKASLLKGPDQLEIDQIEIPALKKGQVLVKMAYAPVNPSDLAFLQGNYGLKKAYPVVPGLEGSGVVVASGGGYMANRLKGKRVACAAPTKGHGTWAEYMITDATMCIPLHESVSLEQGSMLFVNPLTALSFANKAKKNKADLVVLSAAGSALAKMILYFMKLRGIEVWAVVRNNKVIDKLKTEGFDKVFDSSAKDYLSNMASESRSKKRVIFFDAVSGGNTPYEILGALPPKTKMVIYGRLDFNLPGFAPHEILFKENTIEGYWLAKESTQKNLFEIIMDIRKVQKMLKSGFQTEIQAVSALEDLKENLKVYTSNMSAGKVLLKF
jgi:NADPH:quinone reductase